MSVVKTVIRTKIIYEMEYSKISGNIRIKAVRINIFLWTITSYILYICRTVIDLLDVFINDNLNIKNKNVTK